MSLPLSIVSMLYTDDVAYMLTEKAYRRHSTYLGSHQTVEDVNNLIMYITDGRGDMGLTVNIIDLV